MTYMSYPLTAKQSELLAFLDGAGSVAGIYHLSKALTRQYRRVFDDVGKLKAAGLLTVTPIVENGRRVNLIQRASARPAQPELSYSRIWSSPASGVSDRVLIASVLSEPTFADVLACCRHYGVQSVKRVFSAMLGTDEINELTQLSLIRMLSNIEIGFARTP